MMKLSGHFFLLPLALTIVVAESNEQVDSETVCVETKDTLKLSYGREGRAGLPGPKGFTGPGGNDGAKGWKGSPGERGLYGRGGEPGDTGDIGDPGQKGIKGAKGYAGLMGEKGDIGELYLWKGQKGEKGITGEGGMKGVKGLPGNPGAKIDKDIEINILNKYSVAQSGYYNNLYHVTARELTDGRTDTGGWGSESTRIGNYIEAMYIRPVYVTSVTVGGGYIPSWRNYIKRKHGNMNLEYSVDGKSWLKILTFRAPATARTVLYSLRQPVTAQYWRLIAVDKKYVGTTEFALKPLIKP